MASNPTGGTMKTRTVRASPELEAFYLEAMQAFAAVTKRYPNVRTLEVICALSRATGYAIATCYPDERDLARATAIENIDQATADVAQQLPTRKGVQQ